MVRRASLLPTTLGARIPCEVRRIMVPVECPPKLTADPTVSNRAERWLDPHVTVRSFRQSVIVEVNVIVGVVFPTRVFRMGVPLAVLLIRPPPRLCPNKPIVAGLR